MISLVFKQDTALEVVGTLTALDDVFGLIHSARVDMKDSSQRAEFVNTTKTKYAQISFVDSRVTTALTAMETAINS